MKVFKILTDIFPTIPAIELKEERAKLAGCPANTGGRTINLIRRSKSTGMKLTNGSG